MFHMDEYFRPEERIRQVSGGFFVGTWKSGPCQTFHCIAGGRPSLCRVRRYARLLAALPIDLSPGIGERPPGLQ
jgi:hypothetical protein